VQNMDAPVVGSVRSAWCELRHNTCLLKSYFGQSEESPSVVQFVPHDVGILALRVPLRDFPPENQ